MHELHDQAHPCHSHPPFVSTSIANTGLKTFLAPLPAALLAVPSGSTGRIQQHTTSSPNSREDQNASAGQEGRDVDQGGLN